MGTEQTPTEGRFGDYSYSQIRSAINGDDFFLPPDPNSKKGEIKLTLALLTEGRNIHIAQDTQQNTTLPHNGEAEHPMSPNRLDAIQLVTNKA